MNEAARSFVDMDELECKAGKVVAEITGAEAGYVTAGAAAGLMLAAAGCMTGTDRSLMKRLPNTQGMKNEVIIQRGHRNDYDQAVTTAGARLLEVGFVYQTHPWEIEGAISEATAAILYISHMRGAQAGMVTLPEIIQIARAKSIPVVVDAATQIPPATNLTRFTAMGADLVVYSGGKAIRAPSASGFVCGRQSLIEACAMQAFPHHGIGRPMKVGKEEIVGLITALQQYVARDHDADLRSWEAKVAYLIGELAALPHVDVSRSFPDEAGRPIPRVRLRLREKVSELSAVDVVIRLLEGEPPISVVGYLAGEGVILLDPICLQDGEEVLVARRLWELLTS